LFPSLYLTK
jgi:hypothetical protein